MYILAFQTPSILPETLSCVKVAVALGDEYNSCMMTMVAKGSWLKGTP